MEGKHSKEISLSKRKDSLAEQDWAAQEEQNKARDGMSLCRFLLSSLSVCVW